jgi:hypothetical protein
MAEIQSQIKAPKGQTNTFGKYKYRSCEDILEAVKPVLLKYGYSLIITDDVVMVGERYYIKATACIIGDGVTFQATAYAREEDSKKGMDASQLSGATSSYARKYALNGLFAIDDTKDADFTNQGETKTKQPEAKQSEANKPAAITPISSEAFTMAMEAAKTDKTVYPRVIVKYLLTAFQDEQLFNQFNKHNKQ